MLSNPKNLLKKNKTLTQIDDIKKVNHSAYEFLEFLKEHHEFNEEELKNFNVLQCHLLNMNVLFSDMQNAMKKKS